MITFDVFVPVVVFLGDSLSDRIASHRSDRIGWARSARAIVTERKVIIVR